MTNAEKRKEITDFIVKLYNHLEGKSTYNSDAFLATTKKMSDAQFIAYMKSMVDNPKQHLYFEIKAFDREPTYEQVETAAYKIVGDEYCHLYDYIALPYASADPEHPSFTVHKVFNGYVNVRRVQQIVNHKTHYTTDNDKRDPKTGQVTQESKAARISDTEMIGMVCHGTKNVMKEMFGPRGGDAIMRDEMDRQISTSGSALLGEMHDSKLNKTALNTTNNYLIAAGYESNMITKNGILPRTLLNASTDARVMDRESKPNL